MSNENPVATFINVPNLLTVSRLLLVPCFFACLYYEYLGYDQVAIPMRVLLLVIVMSDFLDGYLARRWNTVTTLGRVLDPLADKFFVVTSYLLLTAFQQVPPWLTIIVVTKDLMVLGGWCVMALLYQIYEVNPSRLGKLATAAQFVCVVAVVMLPDGFNLHWFFITTALLTASALLHYMIQLLKLEVRQSSEHESE